MRAKLESHATFETIKDSLDLIGILEVIRETTFRFDGERYLYQALYGAQRSYFLYYQNRDMTNADYLETFQNMIDIMDQYGDGVGLHPVIIEAELKAVDTNLTLTTADPA